MIVGLSGYASTGKDSVADALVEIGYAKVAFADALREMASAIDPIVGWTTAESWWSLGFSRAVPVRYNEALADHGYTDAKRVFPELRRFLQVLATEGVRGTFGENAWVDVAMRKVNSEHSEHDIVMPDVRFHSEAAAIRGVGGLIFRVERPGRGPVNGHESEIALDDYAFDGWIHNDGPLEDLASKVYAAVSAAIG